jgi:hypothetical protein
MTSVLPIVQVCVGLACLVYAVVSLARNAGAVRLPWRSSVEPTPRDDLRLVIDLAARLRDRRNFAAVEACQRLVDELLKPGEQKP